MVKSLRQSNNILTQRYENALLAAQGDDRLISPTKSQPSHIDTKYWEERIRDADKQAAANYEAFVNTKQRLDELSNQSLMSPSKPGTAIDSIDSAALAKKARSAKLEEEIAINQNKLKNIKAAKFRKVNAALKVQHFLSKRFLPFFRQKKKERRLMRWWTLLSDELIELKHLKRNIQRNVAAIHFQRLGRGMLCRKKIDGKTDKAIKIQKLYRGKKARDRCCLLKEELALENAKKLRLLQDQATHVITSLLCTNSYRCKRLRVLTQRIIDEQLRQKKDRAANVIQRGSFRKLRRMSLKIKLEEVRRLKMEEFAQKEKASELLEQKQFAVEEERVKELIQRESDVRRSIAKKEEEKRIFEETLRRNISAAVIQSAVKDK